MISSNEAEISEVSSGLSEDNTFKKGNERTEVFSRNVNLALLVIKEKLDYALWRNNQRFEIYLREYLKILILVYNGGLWETNILEYGSGKKIILYKHNRLKGDPKDVELFFLFTKDTFDIYRLPNRIFLLLSEVQRKTLNIIWISSLSSKCVQYSWMIRNKYLPQATII